MDSERSAGIPEEMKHNHIDEYASGPCAETKANPETRAA